MYEKTYPKERFKITLDFIKKHLSTDEQILDLGVENPLSSLMKQSGFKVINTSGEDLDDDQTALQKNNYDKKYKRQKFAKIYIKCYNNSMEGFYTLAFVSFCKHNVLINMETEPSK